MFIDVGAERFVGAEKAGRKIAVEIKSFLGSSEVRELELTLGQFWLYGDALARKDPDRVLFVAVRTQVYRDVFLDRWVRWSWKTVACDCWYLTPIEGR